MLDAFLLQELIQFAGDAHGSRRIPEIRGADFDGGRAGDEEFGRVEAV